MARKKQPTKSTKTRLNVDQAVVLDDFAANAYIAADELHIKTKPVKRLPLNADERTTLAELSTLPANLKKKLAKKDAAFTVVDVDRMVRAVGESFGDAEPKKQAALLLISKKLMDCLQENIAMPDAPVKTKKVNPADTVYQFKITLLESHPPIWRRIQIRDCTLDNLHEHIQTAMGWTNSHLNQFRIGEQRYANPMLMKGDFEEFGYQDSTTTTISEILPKTGKKFRFQYEYDFGDSWHHEVFFEGVVQAQSKVTYPLCLVGERACPPEDCGGIWGYPDFVAAIQNKDNERHEELLEWVGGSFDPEAFDPAAATKAMRKGLPDWSRMM